MTKPRNQQNTASLSEKAVLQQQPQVVGAELNLRTNFSVAHVRAALHAAEQAYAVEQNNEGQPHGAWFDQLLIHVPVSIVMSAASIDAMVNEWTQDVLDKFEREDREVLRIHRNINIERNSREDGLKNLRDSRSGNGPERFKKLCLYLKHSLEENASELQEADLLTKFRNHFMHFRPSWTDNPKKDELKLIRKLNERGVALYENIEGRKQCTHQMMSYQCARWAIVTAFNFSKYGSNELGFKGRLERAGLSCELPE